MKSNQWISLVLVFLGALGLLPCSHTDGYATGTVSSMCRNALCQLSVLENPGDPQSTPQVVQVCTDTTLVWCTTAWGGAPKISAHVYCGQMAGWMKVVLGTEVGLSPGRLCVPQKGAEPPSPIFGPFLLWPNSCMHQNTISSEQSLWNMLSDALHRLSGTHCLLQLLDATRCQCSNLD